jgi:cytochrome c biogenesis protein CcmG/thiol:disulfide interchange protein DsbE
VRLTRTLVLVLVGSLLIACSADPEPTPIPETNPQAFRALLADLDRPAIVNVWASWCLPCRDEAPILEAAHRRYGDQVAFIGIDYQDAQPAGRDFIAEFDLTYPQYFDFEGLVPADLGGIGVPRTYFFAPGGELIKVHNGVLDAESLESEIAALLASEPPEE